MAQDVDNIIQGAAEIFLGNKGAAFPTMAAATLPITGAGNMPAAGGYTSVGYTSEGLDITFEPDYLDVEVDQLLDSAALFKTSQRVTIATSFTEATLANLAFFLGQKANTVSGAFAVSGDVRKITINGGALGSAPEERSFVAVGPSVREGSFASGTTKFAERIYYDPRVSSVESVSTAVKRNEASVFPVTFRCLPDSTQTNSEYGKVVDRIYGT